MILDILVASILVWSMFSGLISGLIMSVTSFVGLIASALITARYLDDFYKMVVSFIKINKFPNDLSRNYYLYISSYIIMMLSIYIVIYGFARILKAIFGKLMLDWVDRIFGAIFGIVKGLIISIFVLSLVVFASKYVDSIKSLANNSKAIEMLPEVSNVILGFLPEEIRESIERYSI